jgi:hypothetical protein
MGPLVDVASDGLFLLRSLEQYTTVGWHGYGIRQRDRLLGPHFVGLGSFEVEVVGVDDLGCRLRLAIDERNRPAVDKLLAPDIDNPLP